MENGVPLLTYETRTLNSDLLFTTSVPYNWFLRDLFFDETRQSLSFFCVRPLTSTDEYT